MNSYRKNVKINLKLKIFSITAQNIFLRVVRLSTDYDSPFEDKVANYSQYNQRNDESDDVKCKLACVHCDFLQELVRISVEKYF